MSACCEDEEKGKLTVLGGTGMPSTCVCSAREGLSNNVSNLSPTSNTAACTAVHVRRKTRGFDLAWPTIVIDELIQRRRSAVVAFVSLRKVVGLGHTFCVRYQRDQRRLAVRQQSEL